MHNITIKYLHYEQTFKGLSLGVNCVKIAGFKRYLMSSHPYYLEYNYNNRIKDKTSPGRSNKV